MTLRQRHHNPRGYGLKAFDRAQQHRLAGKRQKLLRHFAAKALPASAGHHYHIYVGFGVLHYGKVTNLRPKLQYRPQFTNFGGNPVSPFTKLGINLVNTLTKFATILVI